MTVTPAPSRITMRRTSRAQRRRTREPLWGSSWAGTTP